MNIIHSLKNVEMAEDFVEENQRFSLHKQIYKNRYGLSRIGHILVGIFYPEQKEGDIFSITNIYKDITFFVPKSFFLPLKDNFIEVWRTVFHHLDYNIQTSTGIPPKNVYFLYLNHRDTLYFPKFFKSNYLNSIIYYGGGGIDILDINTNDMNTKEISKDVLLEDYLG